MTNINELLYMVRMRDEDASRMLIEEMMPYINYEISSVVNSYRPMRMYEDDLRQESNVCFAIAIEMYREDRGCSFRSYLQMIVRRKIWAQVRMLNHRITPGFNDTIELDEPMISDDAIINMIENRTPMNNPEYCLSFKEAGGKIMKFRDSLKEREKAIFNSYLYGESGEEERQRLDLSYKQYEGRVRRMRKRIRKALMEQ